MELVSKAADSIAEGDIVERSERAIPFHVQCQIRQVVRECTLNNRKYLLSLYIIFASKQKIFTRFGIKQKLLPDGSDGLKKFAKLLPLKEMGESSLAAKKYVFSTVIMSINYPDRVGLAFVSPGP
jgi:hypothetical protein